VTEHLELSAPSTGQTPAERTAAWLRTATPARIFTGRAGSSYRTATLLALRGDHAAARDAVSTPLDLDAPGMAALADRFPWTVVATMADSRHRYLRRPDLGRRLSPQARQVICAEHTLGPDMQIVIGDGLSSTAVLAQVPALLPLLYEGCAARGWSLGRPIVVRQCRVGVLNEIGELLDPAVVVLLIGERPGLATADSLSAYLAYRPRPGHTDADRNLLSNIHHAGIPVREAASRIVGLAQALMAGERSGVTVKEPAALES
jgi:ethanolamine ammonia-lyase small subunit